MFSQYHDFFGELYEEIHASIDETAEEIRKLNYPAPLSIVELYADKSMSMPQAEVAIGSSKLMQMLQELDNDNTAVIDALNRAFTLANEANEQGLADYIASRLGVHKKHRWMIRSSMKSSS
jgi:starvation-inducible DNA-binding protein